MFPFLSRKEQLPWKSPHLPPSSSLGSGFPWERISSPTDSILLLLRSRLVALLVLGTMIVFLLVSYLAGVPLPLVALSATSFPSHGLKRELWHQLNAIHLRHFVLQPNEIPWEKQTEMETPVPWYSDDLLPPRAVSLAAAAQRGVPNLPSTQLVNGELIPHHRIDAFPRVPLLQPGAHTPRGRDLIFGMTTTVKRAKVMSELWTRWLLPTADMDANDRPGCVVLLSREEDPVEIEELRAILKGRGLVCGLRTSDHERYEVRVLSMTRELRHYGKETG